MNARSRWKKRSKDGLQWLEQISALDAVAVVMQRRNIPIPKNDKGLDAVCVVASYIINNQSKLKGLIANLNASKVSL